MYTLLNLTHQCKWNAQAKKQVSPANDYLLHPFVWMNANSIRAKYRTYWDKGLPLVSLKTSQSDSSMPVGGRVGHAYRAKVSEYGSKLKVVNWNLIASR